MSLENILAKMAGTSGLDEGGKTQVYKLIEFVVTFRKAAADGMAGTATAETKFWTNPYAYSCTVVGVTINADANVVADPTNFATIFLTIDDGAATAPVTAASHSTLTTAQAGLLTDISKASVLTPANVNVLPGGSLYFNISKTAAGVVVQPLDYNVVLRKAG